MTLALVFQTAILLSATVLAYLAGVARGKRKATEPVTPIAAPVASSVDAPSVVRLGADVTFGKLARSIGHELAQPVASFVNYVAVARRLGTLDSAQHALERIDAIAERLRNLSNQLRFFARKEASEVSRVRAPALLDEIAGAMRDEACGRGVDIVARTEDGAEPLLLHCKKDMMIRALSNVAHNAIAAAEMTRRAGGRGTVVMTCRREKELAVFEVFDTGDGLGHMSLADVTLLFVGTQVSGKGLGLGLTIASEIARDHGGHLTASRTADALTCFAMHIPTGVPPSAR